MEPATVVALAKNQGETLDESTVATRYATRDFNAFLEAYKWVTSYLRAPADYVLVARRMSEQMLAQNVVYADIDGNIGYQPMGFVPIRASATPSSAKAALAGDPGADDGTVPVNGADGKHDWTGYLPFDKLPSLYNPPSGIIATANSKITAPAAMMVAAK